MLSQGNRIRRLTQQIATVALDLLYPPHCVSCGRVGSVLCARCLPTVERASARSVYGLDGVRVWAGYKGAVQAAVHAFKYDGRTRLVRVLGEWLVEGLAEACWPVELIVPVPLHASRLRERGYNQSALLARAAAQHFGWSYSDEALVRVRETASQVDLTARERQANVLGAFAAKEGIVSGKCVLVVDDVLTTGATLAACAAALRDAGAQRVFGATVAGTVL